MSRHAGIPLLSGSPPRSGPSQGACRKCGREFNLLFNRRRQCMHCGYDYCSSCTDYQALLPRRSPTHGYDLASVCAFCIEVLNITALGRAQLRSLPLAKLRRYIDAYNISVKNPIDKNDLVDAIVATRTLQGCLPPINENYYRKHSVPSYSTPGSSSSSSRNSSTRGFPNTNTNNSNPRSNVRSFPRPDLDPNHQRAREAPYATYTPRTANAQRPRTTSAPLNPGTPRPHSEPPNISRPTSSSGRPSGSTNNDTTQSSHSHLPPPPMSTLVTLPRSSLAALSVGTLKQILWESRVRVPPGVVEKEDLVERVWALVEEEKRKDEEVPHDPGFDVDEDGAGSIGELGREEEAVVEMVNPASDARPEGTNVHGRGDDCETVHLSTMNYGLPSSRPTTPQPSAPSPSPKPKPRPSAKPATAERSGLCVVCQDEEACIAIVDCGHLALCRACSDLILASSRECPLCRTRIVTEARLLRIFKS